MRLINPIFWAINTDTSDSSFCAHLIAASQMMYSVHPEIPLAVSDKAPKVVKVGMIQSLRT